MQELYERLESLFAEIDKLEWVKELETMQQDMMNDRNLYEKIKRKDPSINYDKRVMQYRKLENELNFLILEIRSHLKSSLSSSKECHYESH